MNRTRLGRRAMLASAALVFIACGGGVIVPMPEAGVAPNACAEATDCAWGEIDHEITTSSECVCLLGCPSQALSKVTVDRRSQQYKLLCTPGKDGKGNTCPIDDCAAPPKLDCQAGKCVAAAAP